MTATPYFKHQKCYPPPDSPPLPPITILIIHYGKRINEKTLANIVIHQKCYPPPDSPPLPPITILIIHYGKRINEKTLANIVIPNRKVKEVCVKLLRPLVRSPTSQKTIEKLLGDDDINWQEVYMIPHKVSISSSIRKFRYKILNNNKDIIIITKISN